MRPAFFCSQSHGIVDFEPGPRQLFVSGIESSHNLRLAYAVVLRFRFTGPGRNHLSTPYREVRDKVVGASLGAWPDSRER